MNFLRDSEHGGKFAAVSRAAFLKVYNKTVFQIGSQQKFDLVTFVERAKV